VWSTVKKADGTLRLCTDFRGLNSVTLPDPHPLPQIQNLLDNLAGTKVMSTLDLTSSFYQIRTAPEDKSKLAFLTPQGQFVYEVMPFGVKNGSSTFSRLMAIVFENQRNVACFTDDVLVHTATRDYIQVLREVLEKLQKANFKREKPEDE